MAIKNIKAIHLERLCKKITGSGDTYTDKAFDKLKVLVYGIFNEAIMMGVLEYSVARESLKAITKKCKFKQKETQDGQEIDREVYTKEEIEILRAYLRTLPVSTYTLAIEFAISENRLNQHLKEYCEACGIKYRSSHKFRFYGISACYEGGIDEHRIQYLAGHTTVEMTRHYNRSKEKCDNADVCDILS